MAENRVINEDEESGNGGGGNKNALAYGLLQGAGYPTQGMSPSQAWAMVDALKLLDREGRKKLTMKRANTRKRTPTQKKRALQKRA